MVWSNFRKLGSFGAGMIHFLIFTAKKELIFLFQMAPEREREKKKERERERARNGETKEKKALHIDTQMRAGGDRSTIWGYYIIFFVGTVGMKKKSTKIWKKMKYERQTDGRTNRRTDQRTNGWTNAPTDGPTKQGVRD